MEREPKTSKTLAQNARTRPFYQCFQSATRLPSK
jgi:hypothetical protein